MLHQHHHNKIEGILTSYSDLVFQIQEHTADTHSIGKYIVVVGAGVGKCVMVSKKLGPFQNE